MFSNITRTRGNSAGKRVCSADDLSYMSQHLGSKMEGKMGMGGLGSAGGGVVSAESLWAFCLSSVKGQNQLLKKIIL